MSRILITQLPSTISKNSLEKIFSKYGTIISSKIQINGKNNREKIALLDFYDCLINKFEGGKVFFSIFEGKKIKIQKLEDKKKIKTSLNIVEIAQKNKNFSTINQNQSKDTIEVTNFHKTTTHLELTQLFQCFGHITNLHVKKNNSQEKGKTVLVRYGIPDCALKAACFIEKKFFRGTLLKVKEFSILKTKSPVSNHSRFKLFKKLQYRHKKGYFMANSWISFFITNDNILENFNRKFGKNKSLINETINSRFSKNTFLISQGRIYAESRLFLKKEGIKFSLSQFLDFSKKSRRSFFIKSRFYHQDFLKLSVFRKFGEIKNFYFISPAKMIIIEYKKNINAYLAFNYFKNIFDFEKEVTIEWVPLNFIIKDKNPRFKKTKIFNKDANPGIFSKNFSDLMLSNHKLQEIFNISVEPGNKDKKLFELEHIFKSQIKGLEKNPIGKIIVRNIPFQTKLYEIRKIFSIFGKILSIRLPKKKNGENRGFVFIDYCSLNDAKKAMFLIQNTRLQSRNLKVSFLKII